MGSSRPEMKEALRGDLLVPVTAAKTSHAHVKQGSMQTDQDGSRMTE